MREAAIHIASQQEGFAPSLAARALASLGGILEALRAHVRGRRTWLRLYDLDDHILEDIGISRADLEAETRRGTLAGVDRRLAEVARRCRESRWH